MGYFTDFHQHWAPPWPFRPVQAHDARRTTTHLLYRGLAPKIASIGKCVVCVVVRRRFRIIDPTIGCRRRGHAAGDASRVVQARQRYGVDPPFLFAASRCAGIRVRPGRSSSTARANRYAAPASSALTRCARRTASSRSCRFPMPMNPATKASLDETARSPCPVGRPGAPQSTCRETRPRRNVHAGRYGGFQTGSFGR